MYLHSTTAIGLRARARSDMTVSSTMESFGGFLFRRLEALHWLWRFSVVILEMWLLMYCALEDNVSVCSILPEEVFHKLEKKVEYKRINRFC